VNMDNVTKIYSQFKQVEEQLGAIRSLYGKAKELDELTGESAVFTEEAYKLLDTAKEFVTLVEESDTNLDPKKTKLVGVDHLFQGHFVTDHMNNVFNEVYNSQGVPASAFTNKPCCGECTDPCPCEGKQPEIKEVKCLVEGECSYPLCICAIGK
jgi:hypothetical protein